MLRRFNVVAFVVVAVIGSTAGLSGQGRPDFVENRYFVGFRGPTGPGDEASLRSQGLGVGKAFHEIRAIEVVVRNPNQLNAFLRNPRVEYVEEVPMRYAVSLGTSELTPSTSNGLYGLLTTKAVDAHNLGYTGTNVDVGLADTAIDCNHPDISANLANRYIDKVGAETHGACWIPSDGAEETHATHVAGTILGVHNSAGVYGVAFNARLHHARVLGPNGGSTADIMDGVRWLVDTQHVKIVNLSLGGKFSSRTEENFYKSIFNKGVLVVAAAGNDGANRLSYPAGYAENIAVGAVDRNNAIGSFSNNGKNIDVVAPGVGVLSSVPLNQGSEASVTGSATYTAFGMTYAGQTAGLSRPIVNCGLALTVNDCASAFGNIALIQRGTNSFTEKAQNAMNAGAVAAIIYNNVAGDYQGTLGVPTASGGQPWIPVVSVSNATGAALFAQLGSSVNVMNMASSWDTYEGTSMATPHVAGVLALMWGANPSLSNSTIQSYLFSTSGDLGTPGYDKLFGYGIVNALAGVKKAAGIP